MKLIVKTNKGEYPIYLEKGCLNHLSDYINIERKVLVITDKKVPTHYLEKVKSQIPLCFTYITPNGEKAKSFAIYEKIIEYLVANKFNRHDLIIGLGGGVIGDLSGFVAATYLRGIDFVNIPTTTLSQIDSSIGGKVALNVGKTKNMVGCFYPPQQVLIDFETLETLSQRHFNNGLVEALKSGLIYDRSLFELFEHYDPKMIETIIYKSLLVKKAVVEADEYETGLRKILNFGHTLGHGFESYFDLKKLFHGEAVALGMYKVISNEKIKEKLTKIYDQLNLKTKIEYDQEKVFSYILNDKKSDKKKITMVFVDEIGKSYLKDVDLEQVRKYLED